MGFLYVQTLLCLLAPIVALLNYRFLKRAPRKPLAEGEAPMISVCVPARNEVANIGQCLEGLVRQDYPNYEILVLDDCSDDATGEIVESYAAQHPAVRLVRGAPLPEGWIGKSHACAQLGREARGDYFFFTDADTKFEPGCLRYAIEAARAKDTDLLSGLPRLESVTVWERLSVPLLAATYASFIPLATLEWARPRAHAAGSGAFLFFRRAAYEKIGGHEAVKDRIVEDIGMCRAIKRSGGRFGLCDISPHLSVRMYRSLAQVWEGFTKNAFAVFGLNWAAMIVGLAYAWTLWLLPWVWFFFGAAWGWSWTAATLLPLIQIAAITFARLTTDRLAARVDWLGTLLIPVSCLSGTVLCLCAAGRSLRRRPTPWRGRNYDLWKS